MAEAQEQQPQEPMHKGSNRIQVSSSKKPMFFYVNLSKRLLAEHGDIHLSALGMAVSTMVSIAEILKKDGLAVETRLSTCMDSLGGEGGRRPVQKAKMEILLKKSDNFDELIAAEKERQAAEGAAHHEEEEEHGEEDGEEAEE
uniref:DNA/RNA-binding protein Alba-like domain-containing protein n=1 Tax=Tetradesmus obliquus TaxID=3088 RepID=A0A383WMR3_TETOB|eukprot:jgi/Sobl393_1/1593/SZX78553.1